MKSVPFTDDKGLYLEDKLIPDSSYSGILIYPYSAEIDSPKGYLVGVPVPPGLYTPYLNIAEIKKRFGENPANWPESFSSMDASWLWKEKATAEEIKELNPPPPMTEFEQFKHEVAEQNAAVWDFLLLGGV